MSPYDTLLQEANGRPFAAIVGWPVEHSRSPALHGFWLKQHGIDGHYGRLPVEPKRAALEELVAFLKRTPHARGCNLTLPHKIDIMPLLDRIDPLAKHIGAVNTVIKQADGTLEGRNSDGFGFLEALKQGAPGWQAAAGPAVVLGAGGAARAVIAALGSTGCSVRLHARNRAQAEEVAVMSTVELGPWPPEPGSWDVLINCTPIGMFPHVDETPLPADQLTGRYVYDLVYNPATTRLLREAETAGCQTIGGLEMLVAQAREQFQWWTGSKSVAGVMREAALKRLAEFARDEHYLV